MNYPFHAHAILAVLAVVASVALGVVTPPEPRVFASASGATGMKVLPRDKQAAVGILFTLNDDGAEQVLWRRELVNIPRDVVILDEQEDRRLVVTLDSAAMMGGRHALVVYGPAGDALVTLRSEDFIPEHANPPAGSIVSSLGRAWRTTGWSVRQPHGADRPLEVHLGDGRVALIDLATGHITPAHRPPEKPATTK